MPVWYDFFSLVYDRALEDLYRPFRPAAVEALRLVPGATVVDLPCGTGQSLDGLTAAVGPSGRVVGLDASTGMLKRARRRVQRNGWANVTLHERRADAVGPNVLGGGLADGVLCALGLTAFPDGEAAFERAFGLLRPGGRFVLLDVYARERTRQTASVELVARADLSREAWRPLEAACPDFERRVLPADPAVFGGELYVASGTRGGDTVSGFGLQPD